MNLEAQITQLAAHAQVIRSLTHGVPAEQAAWKPSPDAWGMVEVVNHLYDEEREDFRSHLDTILRGPEAPWAPIDPQGWVTQRAYNQRGLAESVASFLREREQSLAWLRGLNTADWDAAYPRPWGTSPPATCSPRGSPTTCCTSGSLSSCVGSIWSPQSRRTRSSMRENGSQHAHYTRLR